MHTPLREEDVRALELQDIVYIKGTIYTGRDMAHLRMKTLLNENKPLPFSLKENVLFHAGPVALKTSDGGYALSVIGPTKSIRMEPYADMVGTLGVRAVIGKGGMWEETLNACREHGYVYLQAAPGCAAYLAQGIERIRSFHWLDLGMPEAVWELQALRFGPLVVAMDTHGNSIYKNLADNARRRIEELYPQVDPDRG